jgi:hypothetical protein
VYGKLESGALHELSDSSTGSFSDESEILVEDRRRLLLLFSSINFNFSPPLLLSHSLPLSISLALFFTQNNN